MNAAVRRAAKAHQVADRALAGGRQAAQEALAGVAVGGLFLHLVAIFWRTVAIGAAVHLAVC